jgi:hypothetical protein
MSVLELGFGVMYLAEIRLYWAANTLVLTNTDIAVLSSACAISISLQSAGQRQEVPRWCGVDWARLVDERDAILV